MSTKGTSTTKSARKGSGRTRRTFTALEKCEAVLAIWTETQTMSEVGRSLNASWGQLKAWQNQAMDGMLQALEPKERKGPSTCPPLSGTLQRMLSKRGLSDEAARVVTPSLQKRLAQVQNSEKQEG